MKPNIVVLTLITCMQFTAACTQFYRLDQIGSPAPKSTAQTQGTGDGGGGNLINGRMIESYIINPEDLPAAQKYVLPILEKIYPDKKAESEKQVKGHYLKLKTWYLGDFSLENIPKKILGVEMAKNQVDQVAYQTEDAIWIDARLFNQMSEQEQAYLIMHEFNMATYLLRFEGLAKMCEYSKRVSSGCEIQPDMMSILEKTFKPLPKRDLNSKDYNLIREATQWLLSQNKDLTEKSWKQFANSTGFADPRMTEQDEQQGASASPASTKISAERFKIVLNAAINTQTLPKVCHQINANLDFPCSYKFDISEKNFTYSDQQNQLSYKMTVMTITIVNTQTQEVVTATDFILTPEANTIFAASSKKAVWNGVGYALSQTHSAGSKGYVVTLLFSDLESLRLTDIILRPMANNGTETYTKKDPEGHEYLCSKVYIDAIKGSDLQSDAISIGSSVETIGLYQNITYSNSENCKIK